jgi:hypothetical protein
MWSWSARWLGLSGVALRSRLKRSIGLISAPVSWLPAPAEFDLPLSILNEVIGRPRHISYEIVAICNEMSNVPKMRELSNKMPVEAVCDIGGNLGVQEGVVKIGQHQAGNGRWVESQRACPFPRGAKLFW